jgi:hypothetical protein
MFISELTPAKNRSSARRADLISSRKDLSTHTFDSGTSHQRLIFIVNSLSGLSDLEKQTEAAILPSINVKVI